jgi:hypothetical protein
MKVGRVGEPSSDSWSCLALRPRRDRAGDRVAGSQPVWKSGLSRVSLHLRQAVSERDHTAMLAELPAQPSCSAGLGDGPSAAIQEVVPALEPLSNVQLQRTIEVLHTKPGSDLRSDGDETHNRAVFCGMGGNLEFPVRKRPFECRVPAFRDGLRNLHCGAVVFGGFLNIDELPD